MERLSRKEKRLMDNSVVIAEGGNKGDEMVMEKNTI